MSYAKQPYFLAKAICMNSLITGKNPFLLFLLLLCILPNYFAFGAAIDISNLSQSTNSDVFEVNSSPDSYIGAAFKTPTGVVTLQSVVLPIKVINNSAPMVLYLYKVNGEPDADFNQPGTGDDPILLASPSFTTNSTNFVNYSFSGGGITLAPDSWYWITAQSSGGGRYVWSFTSSLASTPNPIFAGFSQYSDFDAIWANYPYTAPFTPSIPQFSVVGTTSTGLTFNTWSGNASQTADANNDGINNLMAYALGAGNATVNARALLPVLSPVSGGYKYTVGNATRSDVTYQVQMSTSTSLANATWTANTTAGGVLASKTGGGSWAAGPVTSGITLNATSTGIEIIDTNNTIRRFWRLSVTSP
ncbi:MAG: hypothetical protein SFU85_04160 [Candidatus Methylacidiphilales bacterium]|nr:hypothetical protein [Candidatus Methylacidiphilales bacterium]